MSAPIFKADALFAQRMFSAAGLYAAALDGDWGPKTQAAQDAFDAFYTKCKIDFGEFDPRSEAIILGLLPKAQFAAREFMKAAKTAPFTVKLLSGTRSYAEQDHLFRQIPRVTNARGGQSNHNFGIAWDVGIFVGGQYYTGRNAAENKAYADLAKLIKPALPDIEWGGDWVSFKDAPHYQLKTGRSVAQVRALFEAGKPYV